MVHTLLKDARGGIALVFALGLPVLLIAVGGAVEISRSVSTRQRLASAVELTCTHGQLYANARKSKEAKITNLNLTYQEEIKEIARLNFEAKGLKSSDIKIYTTDVNVNVEATEKVSLYFGAILNKSEISFTQSRDCAVKSTLQVLLEKGSAPALLLSESFEQPSHNVAVNAWSVLKDGQGKWNGWSVTGTGIEVNGQRQLAGNAIRFGDFFAELDSYDNSSMSRTMNFEPGSYQIRYWYIARSVDPAQRGKILCGKQDSDLAWYTKDDQTNRIELFVEKQGDYTFNKSNMLDYCVMADAWTERVISFVVPSLSEYRITWRAAGRSDSFGGLIDYLRVCRNSCPQ